MVHSGHAIHHLHKRKRTSLRLEPFPSRRKIIRIVDRAVYIIGTIAVLMTLPQVLKIWIEQNPTGVSLLTWSTYLFSNSIWISYGILHKEKPIIFVCSFGFILNILIVIGLIIYG